MAEMYVGDDVSPDFYGWVFPKYDHVGVGTGTVVNRPAIKEYQVGGVEIALITSPSPGFGFGLAISLRSRAVDCSTVDDTHHYAFIYFYWNLSAREYVRVVDEVEADDLSGVLNRFLAFFV